MTSLLRACFVLGVIFHTANAISFPSPTGRYNTSLVITELTDYKRLDPFAPIKQHRNLMVSVFHPISPADCSPSLTPDFNPITAAFEDAALSEYGVQPGTFESIDLHICQPRANPRHLSTTQNHPLILFSPGLAGTRLFYNAIAQQLASMGYTVVAIDHFSENHYFLWMSRERTTLETLFQLQIVPISAILTPRFSRLAYDAAIVTFSDNSFITAANITTESQILLDLDTRVKDVSFVLDELAQPSIAAKLIPGLDRELDVSKTGIFGHSLGGATAATAMLYDSRLIGAINLDGSFWGDIIQKGLNKPLLLFAHEGKNTTTDPTWGAIWPNLTGWKRELMLAGSKHNTFTDLPNVVDVLGMGESLPPAAVDLLGTIDGARAFEIITTYVEAFFDFVMKGKSSALLDKASVEFPEVSFGSSEESMKKD